MNCGRCDFRTDDEDAAVEHAREAQHWLCVVCERRSLTEFQPQTCAVCVAAVRADLADILTHAALVPAGPLNALTLLGDGTMQRRMHPYETIIPDAHPLAHDDDGRLAPIRDEWPSDPLPVLPALASWEDYLRDDYRDPKGTVPATLSATVNYLSANLDSRHNFAQTFPGFDDLAAEIRAHRPAVLHAAGLADDPVAAHAKCPDCGGPLLRTYQEPLEPVDERRQRAHAAVERLTAPVRRQRHAERSYGIRDLTPWPSEASRDLWLRLAAGQTYEGLTDDWTCQHCRLVYDQPSYFLALRAQSSSWVPVPLAADTARRSVRTLRSWVNRGVVQAACRVVDRTVLVWWPDVADRVFRHADDSVSRRSA